MNGWSNTWSSPQQPPREAQARAYEYSARPRWRALEIAAIVLGFMVWWVVGLSLLLWKLWRNRQGYSTDMITAARTGFQENVMTRWPDLARSFGCRTNRAPARDWGFASFRSSGNSAFDGWREGELARLEEERRKLEAAEREFADYIESLRQAKDREEF
jgi:signal transduction histidine kinase